VRSIFWLLRAFLRLETERMRERGARLQVIGRRDRLPESVLRAIEKSEWRTAAGKGIHLRVAIDYSSRDAIARAAAEAVQTASESSGVSCDELRVNLVNALTGDAGDVDLLIRTGGEKRLSDFLLWESAYAELVFTERTWPEFDEADLDAAIEEFQHRERRFGGVPAPLVSIAGGAR
jgi:undecaprenyl diphosphate synthase